MRELQAEELCWTRYDKDEMTVKKHVTDSIFDTLLTDTCDLFSNIVKKKVTDRSL